MNRLASRLARLEARLAPGVSPVPELLERARRGLTARERPTLAELEAAISSGGWRAQIAEARRRWLHWAAA